MPLETAERIARVRRFNRFYTRQIGALRGGLLDTPYSLAEARVLFELGQVEAIDLAELRAALDIDAGYLSRLLSRLDGLVTRERASGDARRQRVRLSARGRRAYSELDERAAAQVGRLLDALSGDEQRRLVGAMEAVEAILTDEPRPHAYVLRPPRAGDYGWIVQRHGTVYADEYGWDERFEGLVARIVADYVDKRDPEREAAWMAEVDGEPAGCVLCVRKSARVAQLRLLLVEPRARGLGIGTRLVDECLAFARRAGYREVTLWTNDVLEDARRIYERAGFELVEEQPHRSFGRDLVGQNWSRRL